MLDHNSSPTLAQREAERVAPSQRVVMKQTWSELLFLHWQYDAEEIQSTLPKGLHVDTHQGNAYLGVVPFLMQKIRPTGLPPVPKLSWFHELNLRTYVHDDKGRPGVWFYSLDCDQPIAVELARKLFHLPYQHAQMSFQRDDELRTFSSKRRGSDVNQNFHYQPKHSEQAYQKAQEGSLDFFLVERYLLYSSDRRGQLYSGRVHHEPYQIQEAKVSEHSAELLNLEGFSAPLVRPCSEIIAKPVDVNVYPLMPHQ